MLQGNKKYYFIVILTLQLVLLIGYLIYMYEGHKMNNIRHKNTVNSSVSIMHDSMRTGGFTYDISNKTNIRDTKLIKKTNQRHGRYMVYECSEKVPKQLCGGLGDRIIGITVTYIWSLLTNRSFIIRHDKPCGLEKFLIPNEIKWNIKVPVDKKELRIPVRPSVHRVTTNALIPDDVHIAQKYKQYDKLTFQGPNNGDHFYRILKLPMYKDQVKLFPFELGKCSMYKTVFDKLFKLSPRLKKNLKKILGRAKPTVDHKLVCAQIRTGRNPSLPNDFTMPRTSKKDIEKFWKFLETNIIVNKTTVFVTSDSDKIQKTARKKFGGIFMEVDGKITHTDRDKNTEACKGMDKVILDFYMLSLCDVAMVSRSGFGRLSQCLNENKNAVIYRMNNMGHVSLSRDR